MANIDNLRKKVDKVQDRLDWLKDNISILPEPEKKTKVAELKTMAESTKVEIQAEILRLSTRFSAEKKKQKAEAEVLLNTVNEIINLQLSILTGNNNGAAGNESGSRSKGKTKEDGDKSSFWDSGRGKALKRTGIIGGIGAGISWLGSKIKGNEDDESDDESNDEDKSEGESADEKKSGDKTKEKKKKEKDNKDKTQFWDTWYGKALKWTGIGTAAYYLSHGIYTKNRFLRDLWDREKGKKLEFDDALKYASGAVANQNNKEGMGYGLNLKYHEDTSEIEAYGIRVKIDKNKRMIDGLNVKFKKYENMICAAIVIAYLKKNYSWKCANNNPFHLNGDWQGDIDVNTGRGREEGLDGTGNQGRVLGVGAAGIAGILTGIFGGPQAGLAVGGVGGVAGYTIGSDIDHDNIMNNVMPELDNEYGKKILSGYLNDMNCRQERNQTQEDISESQIKDGVWICVKKIQEENPDLPAIGGRMAFDAIPDPENPNRYTIKAYGREIYAEIADMDNVFTKNMPKIIIPKEMRILGISGGNPAIKTDMNQGKISDLKLPLQEGLYMSALLGNLLDNYHHKGNEYPRFEYTRRLKDEVLSLAGLIGDARGLFFSDSGFDSIALSEDLFEKNMPILSKKENRNKFLEFLNKGITDEFNVPIWKKSD